MRTERESSDALAAQIRSADARGLRSLMAEGGRRLDPRTVRLILHHPHVTAEVIEEISLDRHLLGTYEIKSAVARHRRTPPTVAQRFVPGLFWRDLVELGLDVRVSPSVRRVADKYLLLRLPKLAIGERIAVARRAGPPILVQLRSDPHPRVIAGLLDNPRLTEQLLLPMIADDRTGPRLLDVVARHRRWWVRYPVRLALCANPMTPFRVVFALLPGLRRCDLKPIADDPRHASVIRHQARSLAMPGSGEPDHSRWPETLDGQAFDP